MDNYNYPEGADTKDAPWNQPDPPEPTAAEIDDAKSEIWPFLSWDESATFDDIANAADELNTDEAFEAVTIAEACGKPNPILAIPNALRETIDKQAADWVDRRAQEIANDIDWDYERECARADDEYDRRREEQDWL